MGLVLAATSVVGIVSLPGEASAVTLVEGSLKLPSATATSATAVDWQLSGGGCTSNEPPTRSQGVDSYFVRAPGVRTASVRALSRTGSYQLKLAFWDSLGAAGNCPFRGVKEDPANDPDDPDEINAHPATSGPAEWVQVYATQGTPLDFVVAWSTTEEAPLPPTDPSNSLGALDEVTPTTSEPLPTTTLPERLQTSPPESEGQEDGTILQANTASAFESAGVVPGVTMAEYAAMSCGSKPITQGVDAWVVPVDGATVATVVGHATDAYILNLAFYGTACRSLGTHRGSIESPDHHDVTTTDGEPANWVVVFATGGSVNIPITITWGRGTTAPTPSTTTTSTVVPVPQPDLPTTTLPHEVAALMPSTTTTVPIHEPPSSSTTTTAPSTTTTAGEPVPTTAAPRVDGGPAGSDSLQPGEMAATQAPTRQRVAPRVLRASTGATPPGTVATKLDSPVGVTSAGPPPTLPALGLQVTAGAGDEQALGAADVTDPMGGPAGAIVAVVLPVALTLLLTGTFVFRQRFRLLLARRAAAPAPSD